jgi:hypothetical protein
MLILIIYGEQFNFIYVLCRVYVAPQNEHFLVTEKTLYQLLLNVLRCSIGIYLR